MRVSLQSGDFNIQKEEPIMFDRETALAVLKDISSNMHPDHNLFGQPVLSIHRDAFERIRAKYLDNKDEVVREQSSSTHN